jgi:hypothetical protein
MFTTTLKRFFEIAKANIKYNYLPQFAFVVLILIFASIIFGITGLDAKASAVPLEMFVSLIGIILLTPIFAPEQSEEVRDTVESKYISSITVCLIRTLISIVVMAFLIGVFAFIMRWNGCDVSFKLAWGTFASALLLGAIGFIAYGISNNIAAGYMLPILYYALNFTGGNKYLGKFYLFSMMKGSYSEKVWLFASGVLMLILTMAWKQYIKKIK